MDAWGAGGSLGNILPLAFRHSREPPRHLLVRRKRTAEARKVLVQLGEEDVESELAAIQASLVDQPGHMQERLFRHPYWNLCFLPCPSRY